MGAINAMLRGFRALKNANTGGRGISGLATKESWINPMQVNLKTGEMGRKIKNGVSLKEANKQLGVGENDKLIGTIPHSSGNGAHFFIKNDNGRVRRVDTHRKSQFDYGNKSEEALQKATKAKGFNYAPVRYDTDALTKKTAALGLGALGYGGYELYEHLSPDSDGNGKSANVIANAAEANTSQNTETASNTEGGSKNRFIKAVSGQLRTPAQEAKLQEIRDRRAREADPEMDLPDYAKSGQGQADPIQPPKAKTNVKPKKSANLNYDPIAEWAKTDQATNDKWLKRQADYKKLVGEGVDPYDAYDRTINLYN